MTHRQAPQPTSGAGPGIRWLPTIDRQPDELERLLDGLASDIFATIGAFALTVSLPDGTARSRLGGVPTARGTTEPDNGPTTVPIDSPHGELGRLTIFPTTGWSAAEPEVDGLVGRCAAALGRYVAAAPPRRGAPIARGWSPGPSADERDTVGLLLALANERRPRLDDDLSEVFPQHRLHLHYQPQIDLVSGKVVGLEALLRWFHPEHGLQSISSLPSDRHRREMLARVADWAVTQVALDSAWLASHGYAAEVATNLSASQVGRADVVGHVIGLVRSAHAPWGLVTVEIREQDLLLDLALGAATVRGLRAAGLKVAVSGATERYWAQMNRVPVDRVKVVLAGEGIDGWDG
jgi:EAL domain-containing protein (putative c-di-GMP-specific phosphodiesterase class I)